MVEQIEGLRREVRALRDELVELRAATAPDERATGTGRGA